MAFVTTPCLQTSSFRRSVSATCARASVRRASVRRASVRHRAVVTARKAREVSAEEIERALQENARPLLIDAFASTLRRYFYLSFAWFAVTLCPLLRTYHFVVFCHQ